MDLFSTASRTKLWLILFGEPQGHNFWRVPSEYAGFGFRKVLEWEMIDEEWFVDKNINAHIQIDWVEEDFEKVDKFVIDMELDRINSFIPLVSLPRRSVLNILTTKVILSVYKSRWTGSEWLDYLERFTHNSYRSW